MYFLTYTEWVRKLFSLDYMSNSEAFWIGTLGLIASVLVAIIIVFFVLSIADIMSVQRHEFTGTIINKSHTDSTESIGVGVGMIGGQIGTVVTSSGNPESWHIIVRNKSDNKVIKIECSMQFMYDSKIGQLINFYGRYGRVFKDYRSFELYKSN